MNENDRVGIPVSYNPMKHADLMFDAIFNTPPARFATRPEEPVPDPVEDTRQQYCDMTSDEQRAFTREKMECMSVDTRADWIGDALTDVDYEMLYDNYATGDFAEIGFIIDRAFREHIGAALAKREGL